VLAGVIYDEITAFQNAPLAAALCVWLMVPALLLHLGLGALGGRRRFAGTAAVAPSELGVPASWRLGLRLLATVVVVLIGAIYATMTLGAFVRVWGTDWTPTLGYFLDTGVDVGLDGTGYGSSDRGLATVMSSLMIAAIAAPIGGLIAVLTAHVVERIRPPGADLLAFLALTPAVLPGIIFGIGYIVAFNLPFGIEALSLTGTAAILVIDVAFSKMYVGVLAARAVLQRSDHGIEEAAESLGAGLLDRLVRVTLPMLASAFLLGTLYVFVEGLTALSSIVFLVSPDHKLAAVAIFNHANSSDFGYAAAKSVAILVVALAAMMLVWVIESRQQRRTRAPRSEIVAASGDPP
jgi:iron(III) transport system permease protein